MGFSATAFLPEDYFFKYILLPRREVNLKGGIKKNNAKAFFYYSRGKLKAASDQEYLNEPRRILLKTARGHQTFRQSDILYIIVKNKLTYLFIKDDTLVLTSTLNELESLLDQQFFFRANRQMLLNINSIARFYPIERSKIKVELISSEKDLNVTISFKKRSSFLNWIDKNL